MIIDELFDRCVEQLRTKAIVVPPLDGVLRPNNRLDEAATIAERIDQPDNAIEVRGQLWFSSGNRLLKLNPLEASEKPQLVEEFENTITCMASKPDGIVAIGYDNGTIAIGAIERERFEPSIHTERMHCPTALAFDDRNALIICRGSKEVKATEMARDLLQIGRTGSVVKIDLSTKESHFVIGELGYPYGLATLPDSDDILVAECWKHRILKVSTTGQSAPEAVVSDLPGYPARMSALPDSQLMLCLYAPRNRLIEFVLRQSEFRKEMVSTIDPEYWIAPTLKSGQNFLEPLQQGGVKTMNIHKPWAPSLSYGMLIRLDNGNRPVDSYHSRANGTRHGVTSCCQIQDRVFVTSKGGDCIVELAQ